MLQFMKKINGSVSIFLIIIMFPMLVFSFTIVDLCKIFMAQDVIADATDLAVDSGLTSYDKVLKDMYGLMATSASADDLSKKMEEYYNATLELSGIQLTEEEKKTVNGFLTGLLGTGADAEALADNQNYLNVRAEKGENGSVITADPVAASAISNPAVMKRQIVEYSKYRGVVSLAAGMLEKLGVLSDSGNQTKAVKSKVKFDKDVSTIGSAAQQLYSQFRIYFYNCGELESGGGTSASGIDAVYSKIDKIKDTEADMLNKYPLWSYSYEKSHSVSANFRSQISKVETDDAWEEYFKKKFDKSLEKKGMPSSASYNDGGLNAASLNTDLGKWFSTCDTLGMFIYLAPFFKSSGKMKSMDTGYDYVPNNASQFATKMKALSSDLGNKGPLSEMYDFFESIIDDKKVFIFDSFEASLEAYYGYLPLFDSKKTAPDTISVKYDTNTSAGAHNANGARSHDYSIEDFADKYREFKTCYEKAVEFRDDNEDIKEDDEDYEDIVALRTALAGLENSKAVKLIKMEDEVLASIEYLQIMALMQMDDWSGSFAAYYYQMYQQYQLINEMTKKDGVLDKFLECIENAKGSAKSMGEAVDKIETESIQSSMKSQYEESAKMIEELKTDDIEEVRTFLKSRGEKLKAILDAMDKFKVEGQKVCSGVKLNDHDDSNSYDIGGYIADSEKIFNSVISGETSSVWNDIKSLIKKNVGLVTETIPATGISSWNDQKIDGTKELKETDFYKTLEKLAKPSDADTDTTVKDKIKDLGETKKDENGNVVPDTMEKDRTKDSDGSGDSSSSGGSSGSGDSDSSEDDNSDKPDFYKLIENAKSFSEYYEELMSTKAESSEDSDDNNMKPQDGSLSTSQSDEDLADSTASGLDNVITLLANLAEAARDDLLMTEYATEMFSCHTTNLDPKGTGVLIKDDAKKETRMNGEKYPEYTNVYRAELEYILYGLDSSTANVAAAGAIIFGIRFALNLIYAFTDAEITQFTLAAATAAGAIFPFSIPLIQTVMRIGLAIAESGIDLTELMMGKSVPLYKSSKTWVCSPRGIAEKGKDVLMDVADTVVDQGTQAIADLIDEGADKLDELVTNGGEKLDDFVDAQAENLKSTIETSIKQPVMEKIQSVITSVENKTNEAKEEVRASLKKSLAELKSGFESQLGLDSIVEQDSVDPETGEKVSADLLKIAEKKVLSKLDTDYIADKVADKLEDLVNALTFKSGEDPWKAATEKLQKVLNEQVFDKLNSAIDDAVDEAKKMSGGLQDKAKEAISKVSSQLKDGTLKTSAEAKEMLHNEISSAFDSKGGKVSLKKNNGGLNEAKGVEKSSALSNALNMSYKDYLFVFTLIGFIAPSESSMLSRMAHVMEVNCDQKEGGSGSYTLNKAVTLLGAKTSGSVKTLFFGAVFNDGQLDMSGKPDRYTFTHSSYMGY